MGKLVQVVGLLVTILIGIDQIGIDVTLLESVLVIAIGALLFGAALAFGVGAEISVSNILVSYYLQKIYKVGDKVRIGHKEGRILEITPLAAILDSTEGRICVPAQEFNEKSSTLLSKESSLWSANSFFRKNLPKPIRPMPRGYSTSLRLRR
ncbi:mechanosensitive ion channel [candidate division KSB1 bacterium]|nr:mechanosensitive ion channel [candidate division KSB1 bacterium]NIR73272.1 mechanosensitive ion channel [candidate division KSB1 bacterium]NIS26978.1 mechanosensitive ion channel [candidate division KSB1 bacterium]NIT73818.1 mechanosensitive ion channel [candidate division KSB1 bacterium]NIU27723.1 mechanosensitive ion channel [candidate division KSB1 bacterium]